MSTFLQVTGALFWANVLVLGPLVLIRDERAMAKREREVLRQWSRLLAIAERRAQEAEARDV